MVLLLLLSTTSGTDSKSPSVVGEADGNGNGNRKISVLTKGSCGQVLEGSTTLHGYFRCHQVLVQGSVDAGVQKAD